ncbi:MAG: RluA family pseudouridine synthase [Candidatus Aquicultor secundus]|uniref:Pseudouridine synthase n=1 Tax=Candidatus Aquicultor secundus TaxID=1973895 RepID=A0A2M7T5C5_9ACTN|nr:RluA family pseudouridine synthase [Candidatus Aquicultor secundus]NCO66322.1 RluA family pseudouridine synthase [Solirubrobacter sp.]PIU27577.1 MAG: RluA family pseudouridine synthase [Candidatus Aquicultor secundus]PIW22582.1 MAG: RluA family pseudouridine synthase [Candidatus Aquicultor secundus]PIX51765.1 MAG: RluA family pseudouridine synthase [Candidatus Aquicultor secundus]PIY39790.1 MAG: RluA family pseudouridine synthase [Candidatus Aquicultor secundus]
MHPEESGTFDEQKGRFKFSLVVEHEDAGRRLDVFLSKNPDIASRNFAQHLIEQGHILVDGTQIDKNNYRLREGQVVDATIPPPEPTEVIPEDIPLDIKYEDDDLIVLSKSAGMVVHPAHGHTTGTLVNALLAHTRNLSGIGGVVRPGIIHRLDKDTSGLMLVAKNDFAHQALSAELKEREIKRTYLTLVHGRFKETGGTVDAPIGRSPRFRQKMAVMGTASREAISYYRVLATFDDYSLVEVSLQTGRTHQIRVHMKYIYHPVVGDPLYGTNGSKRDLGLGRQFLHAYRLEFTHPRTGERMLFEDELPQDLLEILDKLRRMYSSGLR